MSASGGVNDKYLERLARKDWFTNVQAPYFEQAVELLNAKVKSHYVRFFDATSNNIHLIENATALLQSERIQPDLVDRVLGQLEVTIREVTREIEAHTRAGTRLAEDNGVSLEAKFFQEPLKAKAKILSPIAFGYLDVLQKADRLILILESLRLRGVIKRPDCDRQIAHLGHRLKAVPRCAFELAVGLRHTARGEVSEISGQHASNQYSAGDGLTETAFGNIRRLNGAKRTSRPPERTNLSTASPPEGSTPTATTSAIEAG